MAFGSGPVPTVPVPGSGCMSGGEWIVRYRGQIPQAPGPGCALPGRRGLLVGQIRQEEAPITKPQTLEQEFLLSLQQSRQRRLETSRSVDLHTGATSASNGLMKEKRTIYGAGTQRGKAGQLGLSLTVFVCKTNSPPATK
ncbi:hypothetical protein FQN60_004406 [Etheostoma spectabile]|uniref:Uncharacterized protein n=1 Tax=Etheostoma spectabile TaxID=54343 RepID=A0A5J5CTI0_9PERO|nr:hypothetical protein FQN60_004406 [Etheostoma spectabile]